MNYRSNPSSSPSFRPIQQETIFLTATSSNSNGLASSHLQKQSHPPLLSSITSTTSQISTLKQNIFTLIEELKPMQKTPEIRHLFNQILYGLQNNYSQKKSIDKIGEWLRGENNGIKLVRVLNKLKNLRKNVQRINSQNNYESVDKKEQNKSAEFKVNYKKKSNNQCQNAKVLKQSITSVSTPMDASFHRTLPTQPKQNLQWKSIIQSQISYRQRQNKIQSQSQKHLQNRQKFIQKKLLKVKEMNKKVKEIYQKNKNLQKQRIDKHKYEQLFDPDQEMMKRRGKSMNPNRTNEIYNNSQNSYNLLVDDSQLNKQSNNRSNDLKADEKYTKQDIITFKSLKQLMGQNIKGSKSFKTFSKQQNTNLNFNGNLQARNNQQKQSGQCQSYYDKGTLNRSHSLDKDSKGGINLANNIKYQYSHQFGQFSFSSKQHDLKVQIVKEKKHQMEQERFDKMVTQAVEKQKRILRIYRKRNQQSKTKKNSPQQRSTSKDHKRSFQSSPIKSMFKKVIVTKKQLMDKERKIFLNIQNKLQNKEHYLQQRVNKIRQRLKKQQQTKEKYQHTWNQYISYTQNVSVVQSRSGSPDRKKQNLVKVQENAVKKAYFNNLKKLQIHKMHEKLIGLSMADLKKKITVIQHEQARKNKKEIIF